VPLATLCTYFNILSVGAKLTHIRTATRQFSNIDHDEGRTRPSNTASMMMMKPAPGPYKGTAGSREEWFSHHSGTSNYVGHKIVIPQRIAFTAMNGRYGHIVDRQVLVLLVQSFAQ
jgi:hypothetical protein